MSGPPIKSCIPVGMPDAYQKAFTENSKIIEELFPVSMETPIRLQNILHFLDVFIEIFNYSAKPLSSSLNEVVVKGDSPGTRECITKYREYFRQRFRGVQYLPVTKFQGISEPAQFQTLLTIPAESLEQVDSLKRLMALEKSWIEKINEFRRGNDLEWIMSEAVTNFKGKVQTEFPYLYVEEGVSGVNNMRYCEDHVLLWKLKGLVITAKAQYKELIPFLDQEDDSVIAKLCLELEEKLEKNVINDLKIRNRAKKSVVQHYMNAMVDNCVEKYRFYMRMFLEKQDVYLEMEKILNKHKELATQCSPKFVVEENGVKIEIGSQENQINCLDHYNGQTYKIFGKSVKNCNENVELMLGMCEKESAEEVKNCLQKIAKIWETYGLQTFSPKYQTHVEGGLASMFAHVKESNTVTCNALAQAAKPATIDRKPKDDVSPKQLNLNVSTVMGRWKEAFVTKFVECTREFSNQFPPTLHFNLLETYSKEALTQVKKMLHQEYGSDPYLYLAVYGELEKFREAFHAKAKGVIDIKLIENLVMNYYGGSSPQVSFQATTGTDTMYQNGASIQVTTRHQCVTTMSQFQDKSMEELQLEDRERRLAAIKTIMKLVEPVSLPTVPDPAEYSELAGVFQRNLKVSGASNSGNALATPPQSPSPISPNAMFSLGRSPPSSSTEQRRHPSRAARKILK